MTEIRAIVKVIPQENLFLHVLFDNGVGQVIDIEPFLGSGVSSALKDKSYFDQVKVVDGFITWPNGYDFCPNFLYEYILTNK